MTSVLAFNPGHDGAVALIEDGSLKFSFEAEKDSGERNGPIGVSVLTDALNACGSVPDVIATGGWHHMVPNRQQSCIDGSYFGLESGEFKPASVFGAPTSHYSSSHERSHLFLLSGLSPFGTEDRVAFLVYEGVIGSFYVRSRRDRSFVRIPVMREPGSRYGALFALADPSFAAHGGLIPQSYAGKLMALAAFSDGDSPEPKTLETLRALLDTGSVNPFPKARFRSSPLFNCGVDAPELARSVAWMTRAIFERFRSVAATRLPAGAKLLIGGGCGLNCAWNVMWEGSDLFDEVFVPPCPNDSGSAIGTAVDAWNEFTGEDVRLAWTVYSGPSFVHDVKPAGWRSSPLDLGRAARLLEDGVVLPWVEGKCEIGPRALGHRSLLATATSASSHVTLNSIKRREQYRPIAPVCLAEHVDDWFDGARPDKFMLRFSRVTRPAAIPAVCHVDGTARVQACERQVGDIYGLLKEFHRRTGVPMLCNTSLNFAGRGFINRMSDLISFADVNLLDCVVVDSIMWTRTGS